MKMGEGPGPSPAQNERRTIMAYKAQKVSTSPKKQMEIKPLSKRANLPASRTKNVTGTGKDIYRRGKAK